MAELQACTKKGPAMLACLLLFITAMITMNWPAMVMAEHVHGAPPSTLTLYVHDNRVPPNATAIFSASPSAENGGPAVGFGTITVIDHEVKKTAGESPLLGYAVGQITLEKDLSLYLSFTLKLSAPGFFGTIAIQGTSDMEGNGEMAITGGTGMFRWARGYLEQSLVNDDDPMHVVLKEVLYLKYD